MTIQILLHVLREQEKLPRVLYLQFDNCYKENKNRFMLAFCSLLVELKIFQKVGCGYSNIRNPINIIIIIIIIIIKIIIIIIIIYKPICI